MAISDVSFGQFEHVLRSLDGHLGVYGNPNCVATLQGF